MLRKKPMQKPRLLQLFVPADIDVPALDNVSRRHGQLSGTVRLTTLVDVYMCECAPTGVCVCLCVCLFVGVRMYVCAHLYICVIIPKSAFTKKLHISMETTNQCRGKCKTQEYSCDRTNTHVHNSCSHVHSPKHASLMIFTLLIHIHMHTNIHSTYRQLLSDHT